MQWSGASGYIDNCLSHAVASHVIHTDVHIVAYDWLLFKGFAFFAARHIFFGAVPIFASKQMNENGRKKSPCRLDVINSNWMPKPKTNNVDDLMQYILFKCKHIAFGANLFPFEMLHTTIRIVDNLLSHRRRTHVIDESEMQTQPTINSNKSKTNQRDKRRCGKAKRAAMHWHQYLFKH